MYTFNIAKIAAGLIVLLALVGVLALVGWLVKAEDLGEFVYQSLIDLLALYGLFHLLGLLGGGE